MDGGGGLRTTFLANEEIEDFNRVHLMENLIINKNICIAALGREQAEMTGKRLQETLGESVSHVYISTYARAMETGHIILKHLNEGKISIKYV